MQQAFHVVLCALRVSGGQRQPCQIGERFFIVAQVPGFGVGGSQCFPQQVSRPQRCQPFEKVFALVIKSRGAFFCGEIQPRRFDVLTFAQRLARSLRQPSWRDMDAGIFEAPHVGASQIRRMQPACAA